ncbi:uncharacterized protein PADG_00410 [Paracoccidioides brasiliensis Pb18]|uniref:FAD-binding PCMH-type domain-containing protein n=1 Tax=Paracoccidioides brasiliensis (strain Pb18) TaxID=502780 RepID=C1G0M0_PARBD|nr:uncharacterized protein PADG_00410 [Paracoccidioides brasiliensis Pb18]EEH44121.2 hypothetical protein PADG_00410 [Paracoccidioides brasiliensis Pb18]
MEFLALIAAGMVGRFCSHLGGGGFAWIDSLCRGGHNTIASELGPMLSTNAHFYFPGSDDFTQATARWSSLNAPSVTVVVDVATENDVVETVKYANAHNAPFLTYSTGHGSISSLKAVQGGILIRLTRLNSVSIADDGDTATFGGGVRSKQVTDALWAKGKQTVTGICECVSMLGPGLGGGHGILQGRHGLIADQFVSLKMVLADGSLATIHQKSDLWWAMKGAGHNFGIVTSVTSKIYDIQKEGQWSYQSFIFAHDKVEGVYQAINDNLLKDGTQPVDLIHFSLFLNKPEVDSDHAVVLLFIFREGVEAIEAKYADSFSRIDPIVTTSGKGTYKDISRWVGNTNNSPACQKIGLANTFFSLYLQKYNTTAQRAAFDLFSRVTRENPAFNKSVALFQGYTVQGVQAIPSESTAFPYRDANLLVSVITGYEPAGAKRDAEAHAYGERMRQIWFEGSGQEKVVKVYVNSAFGAEDPQSWYGYEPWRLERLRKLKDKYDPDRRFNFYAPFTKD